MTFINLILIVWFLYVGSCVNGQSSLQTIKFDDYLRSMPYRFEIRTISVQDNLEYKDVKEFDRKGHLVMEDSTRYSFHFGFHSVTNYNVVEKKRQVSGVVTFLPPSPPKTAELRMEFDKNGRIVSWNFADLLKEFHYDLLGNCTTMVEIFKGDSITKNIDLQYSQHGRIVKESGNTLHPIEYSYDEKGLLIQEKLFTTTTKYLYDEKGALAYQYIIDEGSDPPFGLFDSRWTKIEYKRNEHGQLLEINYYRGVQEGPDEIVYQVVGTQKFSYESRKGSYEIKIVDSMQQMVTQVTYTNRKPRKT